MVKQWVVVALAGVTFLLVWAIVIIQFIHIKPTLNANEVSSIERSYYKKEFEEETLIDQTIEPSTQTENANEINEMGEKLMVTDLRKLDFSDVVTNDGVPIDIILERLQLN